MHANPIPLRQMVIFDFSGTLSLAGVQFGQTQMLQQKLNESGLVHCGLESVERYWTEVVAPTWTEGGTTATGYQRLMFERIRQISAGRSTVSEAEIWRCVSNFVGDYFNQSVLDPAWKLLLQEIAKTPETLIVIATDHYAEATSHIIQQLNRLQIQAISALQLRQEGQVVVANSADLGCLKASPEFWMQLKQAQDIPALEWIAIVDDFGFNEQSQDPYGAQEKIVSRQIQTVALLAKTFHARVQVFPFFLQSQRPSIAASKEVELAYLEQIDQASRFIRGLINNSP